VGARATYRCDEDRGRPSLGLDWPELGDELNRWGYAVTSLLLDDEQRRELSDLFDLDEDFRSTIVMSRGSSSTTPSDAVGGVYEVA
jgi:hypothetical protein